MRNPSNPTSSASFSSNPAILLPFIVFVWGAWSCLGATPWRVFWHVVLPLIRPGIAAGSLFSFLVSFDNLPISFFFGSPDTSTLPVVMLSYIEQQFDPSIGALSTLQLAAAIIVLILVDRFYGIDKLVVST